MVASIIAVLAALVQSAEPEEKLACPAEAPAQVARFVGVDSGYGAEQLHCRDEDGNHLFLKKTGRTGWLRTERATIDDKGLIQTQSVEGEIQSGINWIEQIRPDGENVTWITPYERQNAQIDGRYYYAPLFAAHGPDMVAAALLKQADHEVALLRGGSVRAERLRWQSFQHGEANVRLQLVALHGTQRHPIHLWLDEDGHGMFHQLMVREGFEALAPQLGAEVRRADRQYLAALSERVRPQSNPQAILISNVQIFDSRSATIQGAQSILIEDDRIVDVGPDLDREDAFMIDGSGLVAVPGLWDMHAHLALPEASHHGRNALLYLAMGITGARDLGSDVDDVLALREAIESGQIIGPRLELYGIIDGASSWDASATDDLADTPEEAVKAVERLAALGFTGIKFYNEVPSDAVRAGAKRAKELGLRVAGHVTFDMTTREAIAAGYDEFQHVDFVVQALNQSSQGAIDAGESWDTYFQLFAGRSLEDPDLQWLVKTLSERQIAVDPTLLLGSVEDFPPDYLKKRLERLPPMERSRLIYRSLAPYQIMGAPVNPMSVPAHREAIELNAAVTKALFDAGAPLLIGADSSDAPIRLFGEMELMVERAGIAPSQVLRLATLGAAQAMGRDDDLGSIDVGKLADIILIEGDPSRDIGALERVRLVIKDGDVFDPAEILALYGISEAR